MDQGISYATVPQPAPGTHVLRLALVVLGAVAGLLILSAAFGSSSASADDGADTPDSLGSAVGGLVTEVTEPVEATVTAVTRTVVAPVVATVTDATRTEPVVAPVVETVQTITQAASATAVTSPVAAVADAAITKLLGPGIVGDVLGTTPVSSLLGPVTRLLDGTLDTAVDSVAAVAEGLAVVVGLADRDAAPALVAATASVAVTVDGAARGLLEAPAFVPAPGDTGASGTAPGAAGLLAALAGAGFLSLLAVRRQGLANRDLPGSPVYETDSSPD